MHSNKLLLQTRSLLCTFVGEIYLLRPTFKLYKDGKEVDFVRGADAATLEAKIKTHYVVPENTQASGSTVSVNGYPDITSNIDVKNVHLILSFLTVRWNV
jgi:hypothetical protein